MSNFWPPSALGARHQKLGRPEQDYVTNEKMNVTKMMVGRNQEDAGVDMSEL